MNNNLPTKADLPSKAQLLKSTIIGIAIAAVILITTVLPAEFGIDPTGIGKLIGLTKMGEIKTSLSTDAAAERSKKEANKDQLSTAMGTKVVVETEKTDPKSEANLSKDSMTFTLKPDEAIEIKLSMNKGEKVNFVWQSDNGRANFDTHGDSKILNINYHTYEKGSVAKDEGILEAAFDGSHGWFWRNRTSGVMNITLDVSGEYSDIRKIM
ncbi:MAG: transmembrane anchor protein [Calditrichaeota bacterium]|nr:transmembrane anchor protein [Calditrichota bacterium]